MVIAIITVIVGAVSVARLPVSQFPDIVPPEIQLLATYVGADALTLEQSVATPIEQQINGVDKMNYMYSLNATGNSQTTVVVNFDVSTDANNDLILTQSRQTQAASQLPADVNNYGVTVQKSATAPLMLVGLYSPKGSRNAEFLANYAYINLNDPIAKRGQPCRPDRRQPGSEGPKVYVFRSRARSPDLARAVWKHRRARGAQWRSRSREGCRQGRTRCAGL